MNSAWAFVTGVVAVSALIELARLAIGRRAGASQARWPRAMGVALLGIASLWANPLVNMYASSASMSALKQDVKPFVGRPASEVVTAFGQPVFRSPSELVYESPWFLGQHAELRVLLADDTVLTAYIDD